MPHFRVTDRHGDGPTMIGMLAWGPHYILTVVHLFVDQVSHQLWQCWASRQLPDTAQAFVFSVKMGVNAPTMRSVQQGTSIVLLQRLLALPIP